MLWCGNNETETRGVHWADRQDFVDGMPSFVSEFGFQSFPRDAHDPLIWLGLRSGHPLGDYAAPLSAEEGMRLVHVGFEPTIAGLGSLKP